jgi:thiosulfate/3-mercaptopyruvate sulfurtransferase
LLFALEAIGREPKGLYDGSWSEWGSRPDLAVERG